MARDISNSADILDSRDIIKRIEDLAAEHADLTDRCNDADATEDERNAARDELVAWQDDYQDELSALRALEDEASGSPDWYHGETLIRDSYFETYAQELAEDCGMLTDVSTWPNRCIDWEQAARELQMDYTSVDFDGITYWIRS